MKRAIAALGLVAVITLIPIGLLLTVGRPFVPSIDAGALMRTLQGSELPAEPIIRAVGLISWALWGYLMLVTIARVAAVVLLRKTSRLAGPLVAFSDAATPPLLRKVIDLVMSGAFLLWVSSGTSAPATAFASTVLVEGRVHHAASNSSALAADSPSYVVKHGDSLWEIAERELGSGYRWREVFELNKGRSFPDGRVLTNPRLIRPGWSLQLPMPKSEPSEAAVTAPVIDSSPQPTHTVVSQPENRPSTRVQENATSADQIQSPVVELPSGTVIAASFASGLLAAQALGSMRRRRSRRVFESGQSEEEPDFVLDLRRAVRSPAGGHLEAAASEVSSAWTRMFGTFPRILAAIETAERATFFLQLSNNSGELMPASTQRVQFSLDGEFVRAEVRRPFPPKLVLGERPIESGLLVPLGAAKGQSLHLGLLGIGSLSIGGPEAGPLATQLILASSADTPCEDLQIYVLGEPDLLGPCRQLNHVRRVGDWADGASMIRDIQIELLARARAFLNKDVEDLWAHYAKDPDEVVPAIVVVATEPPPAFRAAVEAVALQASKLGGALVTVGWRPEFATFAVGASSELTVESLLPGIPLRLRPFQVEPGDVKLAVDIINAARPAAWDSSTEEEPDSPASPPSQPEEDSNRDWEPSRDEVEESLPEGTITDDTAGPRIDITFPAEPAEGAVEVRSLGNFCLVRNKRVIEKGFRATSRELLAYLAAHPEGVGRDRILEHLWPNKDVDSALKEFEWAIYHLRQKSGVGRQAIELLIETYRLNPDHWWTDVGALSSLISQAESSSPEEAIRFLSQAVALYKAPFCDDCYYAWLEPVRDRLRNMVVKASARLANLLMEFGEADEAIAALDRAIEIEPINEDLYRRAMAIEGRLGRRKAVLHRFNILQAVLQDEIDADPDEETLQLVRQLMNEMDRARSAVSED